jgi:anti-sigma B factor antagonist
MPYETLRVEVADSVVRAIGELDIASVEPFTTELHRIADRGQQVVVLDLAELSFVDATGIAAVIAFERQLREQERVLVLCNAQPVVRRVLDLTGLTWLLEATPRGE